MKLKLASSPTSLDHDQASTSTFSHTLQSHLHSCNVSAPTFITNAASLRDLILAPGRPTWTSRPRTGAIDFFSAHGLSQLRFLNGFHSPSIQYLTSVKFRTSLALMLWYILSPIRGTSQPPRLSANHPIRLAFYRHGKTTAQHWLVAMLVSVAIAMGFSYPTVFLSVNPAAGFAAYPQEGVWTTLKPINDIHAKVDVEMRQLWIHGSYMSALGKDVLKRALAVQESLVGHEKLSNVVPALNDNLDSGTLQWGYHSPLMYWNNSAELIDADPDILKTINAQRHTSSSLNVILRPASVFAGKKFAGRQLLAADALIISLMNRVGDDVGNTWQNKMRSLTSGPCESCTLFPHDGHVTRHRVYEFSFTPLSIQEHVALTIAYSFMALYVLLSLRRMKAFHSRFGLVVTAITQMTCSILASFTICGMLKINLSTIPQNAYPFVVLVLGVENVFRLINAVLAYPPTMATEMRIANALGDIGPISVAAAAQNLTILSLLSMVVSPGVAAFCAFAAIATLFDVFFLLTFFVAVLNVDIRRLELQDALAARHNQPRKKRGPSPAHHSWFDALIQGRLPFSTRMAGTTVTTTFILSLNYHFFEHKENSMSLRHLLGLIRGGPPNVGDLDTFAPPPMNATLTPGEWIRMQDFDTAKEVMRLAKPGADSFVVRLFAPLVVVLGDADRSDVSKPGEEWTHALRSLAIHHFYPVAVAIVFIVAFVAVLMNFLLYNEAGDEDNDIALEQLDEFLTTQTINLPHRLDVVKLASSESGHFVTVSLDRTIVVSILDRGRQAYDTVSVPSDVLQRIQWPVRHLAIDDSGEWIACHCADDSILAWNCVSGALISNLVQYPDDHPAVQFTFLSLPTNGSTKVHFLVLTSGGRLAMGCLDEGKSSGADLSTISLIGAAIFDPTAHPRQLAIVTETGVLTSFTWVNGKWEAFKMYLLQFPAGDVSSPSVQLQLYADLDIELLVATTSESAVFLDATTFTQVTNFRLGDVGGRVEDVLIGPSRKCSTCSGLAIRRFAVSARSSAVDDCTLTSWSIDDDDAYICLPGGEPSCKTFDSAVKEQHWVKNAGAWSPSRSQAILGLRKCNHNTEQISADTRRPTTSQLRQRRHARQQANGNGHNEQWEAYKLSLTGDLEILETGHDSESGLGHDTNLYVNSAGPIVPLDSQAVAVAFGNTVRVIRSSRRGSINRGSVSL